MEVAESNVGKSVGLSEEYRNLITDNESIMTSQRNEVHDMLFKMEVQNKNLDRMREENYALRKES